MAPSEKFCLRWNDFESNISVSFRELREDSELFDITLACEEEQVQAHKVILSACSPFFRSVLKRNRHDHPLLYLKGVKFSELQAVLNFMYQGEVNVAQEDLNSFLAVAEELKVKGLTQSASSRPSPPPSKPRARDPPEQDIPAKRSRPSNSAVNSKKSYEKTTYEPEIQEIVPVASVKSEPIVQPEPPAIAAVEQYGGSTGGAVEEYADDYNEYEGGYEGGYDDTIMDTSMGGTPSADGNKEANEMNSDLDKQIEDKMSRLMGTNGEGMLWVCDVCNRKYKDKTKMRHHIETHLDCFVSCPVCNQLCKTRRTLKTHIGRSHGKEELEGKADAFEVVNLEMCMEPKIELS